ncbi:MAG: GNAT family N-acetyltransferase [Thermosulfidibacteraceae bacterium]|jgi:GNAT superfamily N-acetyltransferase
MIESKLRIKRVENKKELIEFIKVPWRIYKGDKHWVPPIVADQIQVLSTDKNPFFRHGEAELFIAYDSQALPIGRIAAIYDTFYKKYRGENIGLFGYFESIDDIDVARSLFSVAEDWLKSKGVSKIIGPFNLSIHNEVGVLVDGFDKPPIFMTTYNKPYYQRLLEESGYTKEKDLLAYWIDVYNRNHDKLFKLAERVMRNQCYRIRKANMRKFDEEIGNFIKIYNSAWMDNWGFIPLNDEEAKFMAKRLKPLVDEDIIAFAEHSGEVVGCILSIADYNFVFKKMNGSLFPFGIVKFFLYRRHIPWARVMALGVLKEHRFKGIESALIAYVLKNGLRKGFYGAELSWTLEDNIAVNNLIEKFGGVRYKVFRVYGKDLDVGGN